MLVASQVAPGKPQILHCSDIPDPERRRRFGSGTHTRLNELRVGEPTTVVFEWTIGEMPVPAGGELLVVWRWPFDWSDLQQTDPAGPGYFRAESVAGPGAARSPAPGSGASRAEPVQLVLRYNWIAGIEPWHHQIQVQVQRGELREGDRVRLICGDTAAGGSGWRAPTCVADRCRFLMLIDHQGDKTRIRLVQEPSFRIVPGAPVRLVALVPSDALAEEPFELLVRAEDEWGNPCSLDMPPVGKVGVTAESDGVSDCDVPLEPIPAPTLRPVLRYRLRRPVGVWRMQVRAGAFHTESNAITVHAAAPELPLFWGDLHSGQTEIGCGCGSLAEAYAFARDCAGLQFITHQANDHYVTQEDWVHTRTVTEEYYEPGRYVPFLGCEWSPLTKDGGDRNVIYRHDEPVLRRSDRFFREEPPDPAPDIPTAADFHAAFHDRQVLVNTHVGGRMTNLKWYDPRIERLCETHSTHGTVEWFFMDALKRGCQVGLTAGTDGVMGRPGADRPGRRLIRNARSGLTAVYARDLTREALWDALQARRCYATTGERIRLWFEVDGCPLGGAITGSETCRISFQVEGTQALERVDVFRGTDVIESHSIAPPRTNADGHFLRVLWGGTERRGTARLQRVDWSGRLAIDAGTIALHETIAYEHCDHARQLDDQQIEWTCATAGNAAGLVIEVCAPATARLTFTSGPITAQITLQDALRATERLSAGGVNRFLEFGPAPSRCGPTRFEHETTDTVPRSGTTPYWIRVTQMDQSQAWSSPVYVTRGR